jgi:STE24 endopeptidase
MMIAVQALLGVGHAGVLLCTGWLPLCHDIPIVGGWLVVPEVIAIVPFLTSVVLVWAVTHPAYAAIRQIALETYIFRSRPIHPVWGTLEYIVYNLRHQVLFILAPMFLILTAREVIGHYEENMARLSGGKFLPDFLLGTATAGVAVIAPVILRYVWVTQRLPEGPLRDRLVTLCKRLKLRYREILVWRSGGMIVNAAVMGVLAPFRYLLITDGMIEQMDDQKIEAVFGHEAGHVKRHHILFFLLFALISGCIVTIAQAFTVGMSGRTRDIAATLVGAVLIFKWGVLFGWISRRFERQADVFGVRTLAMMGLPCSLPCPVHNPAVSLHSPTGQDAAVESGEATEPGGTAVAIARTSTPTVHDKQLVRGDRICTTAAAIFGDTLNQVAVLNGIPPESKSWRHGSIASRSRVLPRYAADPAATARFERHVFRVKIAILTAAIVGAAWAAYEMQLWRLLGVWVALGDSRP